MLLTMYATDGADLAANQVGADLRLFVYVRVPSWTCGPRTRPWRCRNGFGPAILTTRGDAALRHKGGRLHCSLGYRKRPWWTRTTVTTLINDVYTALADAVDAVDAD